jgi:hypothetical protein
MGPTPPRPQAPEEAVDFLPREGYFEARHRGTYSPEPYKEFVEGCFRSCRDHRRDRLFVDISGLRNFNPTATQRFEIGALSSKLGMGLARVAIFGTVEQIEAQFGSLVARNRGLNVRAFSNRDDALGWLLEAEPPRPA